MPNLLSSTRGFLLLVLAVLCIVARPPCAAAPPPYQYVYGAYKQDLEGEVNKVASSGWEVFDVAFTPMNGYLVCYRRPAGREKGIATYAFVLALADNAQSKANAASKNGWGIFKICTTAQHLYCLCFRKESGPGASYVFEHYLAKDCSDIVNEHARRGLNLVDFGFGGDGYLLCFRSGRPNPHPPENLLGNANIVGLNGLFQGLTKKHWEMLDLVQCTDNLCAVWLRKGTGRAYEYGFESVGWGNIASKTEEAIKNGWQVVRVMANNGMHMDFTDPGEMIRQRVPYTLCLRR
jgi:hypothetical protein